MRWLTEKLDFWSYWWFYHRWSKRNDPGWMYFMYLWLGEWLKANPPSESLRSATESFFKTQLEERDRLTQEWLEKNS